MKIPKELLLIFVILLVVAVATQQLSGDQQQQQSEPDLISDSAAPGGAHALYLWLQSLGYKVERLEYQPFKPDETSRVILMLAPSSRPDAEQIDTLRRWVEGGGTLVLAGTAGIALPDVLPAVQLPGNNLDTLLKKFDLALRPLNSMPEAMPGQPLLLHPPVNRAHVESSSYVTGTATLVPYLGESEHPVAAGLAVGNGQVYVLASNYAFSNQGLGQADNGALLLNWLPEPGTAGTVVFDEIHHGRADTRSLAYLMVREPWGWALLYALGMAFLYLALAGRRFGRPVPNIVDTRRAAAEYVVSLAGLLRRGGKGDWVARHYESALRRQLAAACGLDPKLDTVAIADHIGRAGRLPGGVEGQDASRLLLDLHQGAETGISEGPLVRLAAETDRIIETCSGRRE